MTQNPIEQFKAACALVRDIVKAVPDQKAELDFDTIQGFADQILALAVKPKAPSVKPNGGLPAKRGRRRHISQTAEAIADSFSDEP